jgi:hypothetical protein
MFFHLGLAHPRIEPKTASHIVQLDSGAHPAFYSMRAEGKTAGEWIYDFSFV